MGHVQPEHVNACFDKTVNRFFRAACRADRGNDLGPNDLVSG